MRQVRYDLIPMFEVIYREQFRNILYCGDPHESIEIFLRKYQLSEDRSFSFLPIHTKYTYECVLGAIEMGFNVDGYIMTSDDALINSWNIPKLNTSTLWYGGDYNIEITAKDWRSLDPGIDRFVLYCFFVSNFKPRIQSPSIVAFSLCTLPFTKTQITTRCEGPSKLSSFFIV